MDNPDGALDIQGNPTMMQRPGKHPGREMPETSPDAVAGSIPSFDLYGEPQPRARLEPVHLEPLITRSSSNDWKIRPHRHRFLYQLFWIREGGGIVLNRAGEQAVLAPALISIPREKVHGFRFDPGSQGQVLTLTEDFRDACCRLAQDLYLPEEISILPLGEGQTLIGQLDAAFAGMEGIFRGMAGNRNAALAGHVLLLLSLLQQGMAEAAAGQPRSAHAALIQRFRMDIEHHYRNQTDLSAHGRRLGVTQRTLTRACRAVTGRSPLELIHERVMAEARRMLIHGSRNVSAVAYALGFEPAYFSRFFTQREGMSPREFQRRHQG